MLLFLSLAGCSSKPTKTLLGVPVQGTPWEFAGDMYKYSLHARPSFYPECVEQSGPEQASITGWYLTEDIDLDVPAELYCDLESTGQVVNAAIVIGDEIVEVCK